MTLLIRDTHTEGPFRQWRHTFISSPAGSGLSYCDLARPANMKTSALARAVRRATIHLPARAGLA